MIVGDEKPDGGRSASATPCQIAYVDQSRDARPEDGLGGRSPTAATNITVGSNKMNSRAYVGGFNFRLRPAAQGRRAPAASGTRSTWPSC